MLDEINYLNKFKKNKTKNQKFQFCQQPAAYLDSLFTQKYNYSPTSQTPIQLDYIDFGDHH